MLAIGYVLDELANEITGGRTPASFEPSIDYVVTKIPRFAFEKFATADARLTTQMKSACTREYKKRAHTAQHLVSEQAVGKGKKRKKSGRPFTIMHSFDGETLLPRARVELFSSKLAQHRAGLLFVLADPSQLLHHPSPPVRLPLAVGLIARRATWPLPPHGLYELEQLHALLPELRLLCAQQHVTDLARQRALLAPAQPLVRRD